MLFQDFIFFFVKSDNGYICIRLGSASKDVKVGLPSPQQLFDNDF